MRNITSLTRCALQVSQLRELPEGASEIETTLVPVGKVSEVVDKLKTRDMIDEKVNVLRDTIKRACWWLPSLMYSTHWLAGWLACWLAVPGTQIESKYAVG